MCVQEKSTRHKSFRANFMINYAHMSSGDERGSGTIQTRDGEATKKISLIRDAC